MIQWVVDSWIDGKVRRFRSDEIAWQDVPNVLAVHLPHTINGKDYSARMIGADFYFRESPVIFGHWTDPSQPWASRESVGSMLHFSDDAGFQHTRMTEVPHILTKPLPGIALIDGQWEAYLRGELR